MESRAISGNVAEASALSTRFRLLEPLARGGSATVWTALDTQTRTLVAVKFLDPFRDRGARVGEAMSREAVALQRLDHEHIVRPVLFDLHGDPPYLVTELAEGEPLSEFMMRHARGARLLALDVVARIVTQTAAALTHAHGHGIVHRDIKPQNIQVSRPGSALSVKVLDFSVARCLDRSECGTTHGRILGSVFYMSPEQVRCRQQGVATDIFALATLTFELLTLRRCWALEMSGELASCGAPLPVASNGLPEVFGRILHGDRPLVSEYRMGVPFGIEETVARGLCADPRDRPVDIEAFAAPFRAYLDGTTGGWSTQVDLDPSEAPLPTAPLELVVPMPVEPTRVLEDHRPHSVNGSSPELSGRRTRRPSPLLLTTIILFTIAVALWLRPAATWMASVWARPRPIWTEAYHRYHTTPTLSRQSNLLLAVSTSLARLPPGRRTALRENLDRALLQGSMPDLLRSLHAIEDAVWVAEHIEPRDLVGTMTFRRR